MPDSTGDAWWLAGIQAELGSMQRAALDFYANNHADEQARELLIELLSYAWRSLDSRESVEKAVACLQTAIGAPAAALGGEGGNGNGNCEPPWRWDPEREMCVLDP